MKSHLRRAAGFLILLAGGISARGAFAQTGGAADLSPLALGPEDLRIEQYADGGYHLYVRAKPGLASVLLTESTRDPSLKADNYAYRSPDWNAVNGDEKRLLDGAFIPPEKKIYSLIDSSPEPDALLGTAFHLFIPWVVDWGYPWGRNGQTFITDGSFINIRAFSRPYADYSGPFRDNPYLIRVSQRPHMPSAPPAPGPKPAAKVEMERYMPQTVRAFEGLAEAGKGVSTFAAGADDVVPKIAELLDRAEGKSLDLVVCLDTTDSMQDDIESVKRGLPALVQKRLAGFPAFRIGFVLYKDYFEEYLTKKYDFTRDFGVFAGELAAVRVGGGRDIPEAVYEALYSALTDYPWSAEKKMVILIGDAPPHPIPRGKVDRAMVEAESERRKIEMDVIILPH